MAASMYTLIGVVIGALLAIFGVMIQTSLTRQIANSQSQERWLEQIMDLLKEIDEQLEYKLTEIESPPDENGDSKVIGFDWEYFPRNADSASKVVNLINQIKMRLTFEGEVIDRFVESLDGLKIGINIESYVPKKEIDDFHEIASIFISYYRSDSIKIRNILQRLVDR